MSSGVQNRSARKWLVLAIIVMIVWSLFPLYWTIKTAFQSYADAVAYPPMFIPKNVGTGNFLSIFGYEFVGDSGEVVEASAHAPRVIIGIKNSILVSVLTTIFTLLFVVPLSYLFARIEFPHRGKLLFAILFSVALPPVSTSIPYYAMFIQTGLVGTVTGLVLVTLTITVPFITWMTIGYFRNLPPVEKLAVLDGYTRTQFFFRIFVPMAKNGIIVAGVLAFLFAWNEYSYAQLLVNGTPATTLSSALSGFLFMLPFPNQLAATLIISLIPPLVIAVLLQRFISEMNIVDTVK